MNLHNAYVNGALRLEQLYVEMFNKIPNSFLYYEEGMLFKTLDLTEEKCNELFGPCKIFFHEEEKIFSTSKADDRNVMEWDDVSSSFINKTQPYIMVIQDNGITHWIMSIDENSIKIYFDSGFDYKTFVHDVVEKIPKQDKVCKTATIDLVAYDRNYYTINSKIKHTSINFDTHYNDGFADVYKKTIDFLNEQESGLIIWHGEKGSGKTSAIRHLLSNTDKKYILVTNAIAAHMAFEDRGFELVGIFDKRAEEMQDVRIKGISISPIEDLEIYCKEVEPIVAVLCTPTLATPEIVDRLINLGITNFWNFSHYDINAKYSDTIVENVHLSDKLMTLCYRMNNNN